MAKVSIIIPVYNVEKYIRQCLDSVVNQTLRDIEIICINDCTPDNSFKIVEEYASKDSRFVLLEQETNQGQGIARNRALDIATGEYIMFLDPDDWYELDACRKAYNQIVKNKNDILFFDLNIYREKRKGYKIKTGTGRFKNLNKADQHINLAEVNGQWFFTAWTVCQIYSHKFLNKNKIRYSEERFAEDLIFFIKSTIFSEDISILDEPLYNYRQTKVKTFNYPLYFDNVLSSKDKTYQIICESENKDAFLKQFIPYRINSDIYWLKVFSRSKPKIRKEFYNKVKESFKKIETEIPIEILRKSDRYKEFLLIIKSNSWAEYKIKRIWKKLFDKF